jgi:CRISPR system Cascade subunit CasE
MYLSQLRFQVFHAQTRRTLQTPYNLHAAVMGGFPDHKNSPDSRVLFRHELAKACVPWAEVLVQSQIPADWSVLEQDLGPAFSHQQKAVSIVVGKGQFLRYRLRANPVVTKGGKRLPIRGEDHQREWLARRGPKHGFELRDCRLIDEGRWQATKEEGENKHTIAISTVLYEGLLMVSDADEFSNTLAGGIGPAKGFGCGLLSVARA